MIDLLLALLLGLSSPSQRTSSVSASHQKPHGDAAPIEKLEAFTTEHPDDPKGWVVLGLAYWDRDDYARARAAFERAVKVGPGSAEAHNWLGVALAEKADLPGAAAEFRKAIALDPEYGRAYSNLGSTLAQSGDYAEAVKVFRKALSLEPNSIGAHLNLGTALRETGDLDGALEHLRRVADADPNNPSVHYEVGQALRQSGNLAGAITEFERALELDPEMREAYYALGTALKQQGSAARKPAAPSAGAAEDAYRRAQEALEHGDLARARQQLEEALRADEHHADAQTLLGFTLGQQGDLASALPHLERAIALRPDSSNAHYHLGVALWYSGSQARAVTELQQSVSLDPAAGESYAFLGAVLRDRNDWTGARHALQRAIALLPPTAAVYIDLGITFLRAGEFDKALGQFEAGLNVPAPSSPAPDWDDAIAALRSGLSASATTVAQPESSRAEAYNVLGRLLGQAGAPASDVAAAFREATKLRPAYPEAHNNLGLVLIQAGDDPNGIAALREAVRLDPEYAEARANLGAALTATDPEDAIRELERAVALAPNSVKALFNLATAYAARSEGGSAKAIDQLKKVIDLAPTFARAHLALGKALLQDGRVSDAVAALQEAARLEPGSGEAHYQLGLALARAGRNDDAAVELKKGRELAAESDRAQNASLDVAEGRSALDRGDLEEAAAKFRHAKELQPGSAEIERLLATVIEKQAGTRRAETAATVHPVDDPKQVADIERDIRDRRYPQVEPRLIKYVEERPDSSWGWYALGYSLFAQQKIGPSIEALAKSLELDVTNGEAHKILGRDLMIIGRFDAAEVEFTQGLRYQPDSAELHYNLGKLFSIQDNWQRARTEFDAALRIDAAYLEALDGLGFALEALGDDEAAVATYEKAVALNGERHGAFVSAHVNLSAYYNRTGRADAALDYARKAIELDPRSDRAWFQKGRAEERQGDMTRAVDSINHAIALNKRASSYYYVLAGLYRRLGKMDESRKALESFARLEKESSDLDKLRRGGPAPMTPRDPQRE